MDDDTKREINRIVNKEKGFQAHEVIILVIITCIFSFFAGNAFSSNNAKKNTTISGMSEELSTFVKNYQHITSSYYKKLDESELLNEALRTVTDMLDDPYSMYMDEEDYNSWSVALDGSYRGLGISIYKENTEDEITVSGVFTGSPAEKAGIKEGDILVSVNGTKTASISTSEFSQMVINSEETEFKLVIRRDGKEQNITLTKQTVVIPSVETEIFEENGQKIGYIYISIFANNTYRQFQTALSDLEKEKIDSLIIDVRWNTGGHLSAVSNIINLFVDSSHIAYQTEQNGTKTAIYSKGKTTKGYPIVFLADKSSASASEVLIGSLKDNLNAIVIGEKTFGKGTVQELVTLPNGDQYKITTKKWLTPKGTWIEDTKGIIPDIELILSNKYYSDSSFENDNQLKRAIEELSKNITTQ